MILCVLLAQPISFYFHTIEIRFHFPFLYRIVKQIPRNSQSTDMATHIPNTPIRQYTANTTLQPILKIHMEIIDKIIGNCTSAAARSVFGIKKDNGYTVTTQIQ